MNLRSLVQRVCLLPLGEAGRIARCIGAAALMGSGWLVVGCSSTLSGPAMTAADPKTQSTAEYDIARDLFLARNEPRSALAHGLKAVELDEQNADAAHLVALIYLSFCASVSADCRLPEAERYARLAIKNKPDFREADNTLGVILVHQKRYAEAVAVFESLAQDILYPTPETAWGNLGWAYLERGDAEKAIEALQWSIALQPLFCVGSYRLGLAYEKKGNLRAAQDAFSRALETHLAQCQSLQEAYQARARVLVQLGEREKARGDLERCRELGVETAVGRQCAATLANLE